MDAEEAMQLTAHWFVAGCTTILRRLVSYSDTNWLVAHAAQSGAPGTQWVLKIHNPEDSARTDVLEAHNAAMQHCTAAGITTNQPVCSSSGQQILLTKVKGRKQLHAARLLSYVPGRLMGSAPQSAELQTSWGAFMGRLSVVLASFDHPALHHEHDWSMMAAAATIEQRAPQVTSFSQQQRDLLLGAAAALRAAVQRAGQQLPCQICHADANEANLLVDDSRQQVIAVLDFGDMCHCWRAAEVAIAMTYAALLPQLPGTTEAQAAGRVLAGFESACSLLPAERAALPALVRARLALSLANGAATAQQHPENAAYLLQTQRPGWRLLEMWEGVPDDQLLMHWGAAAPAV